jgi:hsp70-interacting protein
MQILILGIIPTLIDLSINDSNEAVRRKAIFALSSSIRNYQPGLDAAQEALPPDHKIDQKLDAADMASVDVLIQKLRDHSQQKA